jgi:catechol 2,3-dioxygenase-like lactoylglutathione lyase family enzyme
MRRHTALSFTLASFVALLAPAAALVAQPLAARAVAEVGMTVDDADRAVEFYSTVLGFEKLSDVEVAGPDHERLQGVFGLRLRVVRMQLGDEVVALMDYLAPEGRPFPQDTRSNDRWFQHLAIVTADMEKAYRWLRQHKVRHASTGPQRLPDWNPNAGGIEAFYFRDPDGHFLEAISFPKGKGDPRWQKPAAKLFLGIDHTAIVVADTDASLRFYRDGLGLKIAGESENYGTEQEHLNNVFGARLRITALRAPSGPGIELLEYLAPRDGRPRPGGVLPNDLLHWQTVLVVAGADEAAKALRSAGGSWISPGAVEIGDPALGIQKGALLGDPDGHALQLIERRPVERGGPKP